MIVPGSLIELSAIKIDQDHVREKAKIIPKNPAKLYHLATFFWLSAHTLPTVQA